ncbi:DeoR/GlpR family DNA-binding transcription regulator [Paenibacillus alvei]|uniref:DeoR/GlpR family DNA-binding transcription regulator n=1 Tax=Paenibacillus alvei TaxID=44250 RepID=A0ABT4GXW0_PAEAL|nr:DeoR/GlpR family DNA-binding transcription regulator [Paenibacillus alvei]MCY7486286.1 DeoR/GlpR family DNA-binding transcription regulator [Paenibacillus alvei]MCY9761551.1 DeoR/GlpR family DNA-binding transcription regulator [Paenibacillus alvei]MCY9767312.1 DeoR/GlpR family DNA-binding transcription regulator [Paenibacillus alvei]
MYQEERLLRILTHLEQHDTMTVGEICAMFGVSRDTARRDIVKLTESGAVTRTHGGITLPRLEQKIEAYATRLNNETDGKGRIGRQAAKLVQDHDMFFLDVSTTVHSMIPYLKAARATAVTHSIDNAILLANHAAVQTHLLGGIVQPKTRHLSGYSTIDKLRDFQFDKAFLGAAGISEAGIYYHYEEDIYMKKEVASRSRQTIVLADHTKLGHRHYYRGLSLTDIDMLITNQPLSPELDHAMKANHVQVLIIS